jgi:hypothetical protein
MRPLDQIPVGALTSPPVAEQLSSLVYAPRQGSGQGSGLSRGAGGASSSLSGLGSKASAAAVAGALIAAGGSVGQSADNATAAPTTAAPFVRLVPSSGVQFLDFSFSADGLSRTIGQFTEDHIGTESGQRTVLVDVGRDAGDDGVVWHPLTKRPLGPDEFLTISGFAGLEPFLDTWVPLPYLRFRGRTAAGQPVHDPGPANWVRAYIASPKGGLRSAKTLNAVLAFDTKLAPVYGTGEAADVGPSAYDALFGSTFQMNDKLADLGMFVSESWVDDWLKGSFDDYARRMAADSAASPSTSAGPSGRFELEHLARYLTYLAVLTRGATLPQIRFADSFSNAWQMPVTGVDLVLDMAAETTCALLVIRDAARGHTLSADSVLAGAEPLRLRDLNNPVQVHSAAPSTAVEFDGCSFGNAVASRRSGRTDAFQWPSLVRVGTEAERLALRTSATPGVTGRHSLFAGLNEIAVSDAVWRFSRDDASGVDQGPIVAGEALTHLTEDGTVIGRFDQSGVPAIRPRFSESSLIGLFAGELLMHALVQINQPQWSGAGNGAASAACGSAVPSTEATAGATRQLQRILVTVASAVSDEDRRLLQTRIEGAIDLLWKAMRWDDEATVARPPKPQVSLGIGADVSAQLVYVFDEITTRFGGDATEYLQVLRRPAADRPASVFRIARIDFESASTGLTVVDYDVTNEGGVRPTISAAERSTVGRDAVLAAFADGEIWPAIADQLQAAGVADARAFLSAIMADRAAQAGVALPGHFARRFDGKIIRPAAESCLRSCETAPARAADAARVFTLKTLVARGGGRLDGLAKPFNAAAAAAGATGFRLENVTVRVRQRHAAVLIRQALDPVLAPFCSLIAGAACDQVLLEGRLAQLPDLVDELRRRLALPAHCIVVAAQLAPSAVAAPVGSGRDGEAHLQSQPRIGSTRMAGAVGAYLASQQALHAANFKFLTGDLAASLQHYRPVAIARSARPTRLLADSQAGPVPLAAVNAAGPANDGHGRTQGTLVLVNGASLNGPALFGPNLNGPNLNGGGSYDPAPPMSYADDGAPRRRYAGAERDQ